MRCSACPGSHRCLAPSGPPGRLLFIGEAPGREEERKGEVFIGKTGQEVNSHYLPLAGLRRADVRFTNAIRCLPDTPQHKLDPSKAPHLALLDACAHAHLYPEIESGVAEVLVPMGAFACRAVFGEAFDLELRHGIPTDTPWGIPAFPMYHPALGIHEPKKMLYIRNDWERLRRFLRGRLTAPVDPYPHPVYTEVTHVSAFDALDPDTPLGLDTESRRGGAPFCVTLSNRPGTGCLVRADRPDLVAGLARRLRGWRAPLVLHHYLHDHPVLRALGIDLPYRWVRDTMSLVYHLGNLPQGLKALAYRELGMAMQDFPDVVAPHSRENVLLYYTLAQLQEWPKPPEEYVQDSKTGDWKLYRPQGFGTKLKRFFTDLRKDPTKDVFQAWENWSAHHAQVEAVLGPWPGLCISHVPFDQALYYACRDADATLRLYYLLRRMRRYVRKTDQGGWRERAG